MRKVGVDDARGRKRVQTVNTDPSMTVQSDAHLADIQNILKSFGAGGQEMLSNVDDIFMDVSEFTDLADALNQAKAAEVEFMKLPSKVREIFEHDVAVWLDTAHDKDKRDALVAAGLLEPEAVQARTTNPPPSPSPVTKGAPAITAEAEGDQATGAE